MTPSLKPIALAALLTTAVGLTSLVGGCAATATRESTGEYVDNASITIKVKAAFVKDPVVKVLDVKVETFKSVVQLSGFVDTEEEKVQAGRVAASVAGVTEVRNNIVVK